MFAATYQSASTFTVPGDMTGLFPAGLPVLMVQSSGNKQVQTLASIYQATPDSTLISVDEAVLDATLTEVQTGFAFVDEANEVGSLPRHTHRSKWSGGDEPYADFDDQDNVDDLSTLIDTIQAATALNILRIASGGGVEAVTPAVIKSALAIALSGLGDVTVTSPTNGQVLKYDGTTEKWVNGTDVSGGSSGTSTASWAAYYGF